MTPARVARVRALPLRQPFTFSLVNFAMVWPSLVLGSNEVYVLGPILPWTVQNRSISPNLFVRYWSKPSLKIGSLNKAYLFWYWQQLEKYFLGLFSFFVFKIESWNFQRLKKKILKPHKISILSELAECVEIFWTFMKLNVKQMLNVSALYLEKQKVLFLKNVF